MRYLSQLAHETTARVTPSRAPSWLAPIAPLASTGGDREAGLALQETGFDGLSETLEATPPASHATTVVTRPAPILRGTEPVPAEAVDPIDPVRTAGAPRPLVPAMRARLPGAMTGIAAATLSPDHNVLSPARTGTTVAASPADVATCGPTTGARDAAAARLPATLDSVLAEIARRQSALDDRDHGDSLAAHEAAPRRRELGARHGGPAQEQPLRVEIGSIVVQVEGEPAPAPAPRARPVLGAARSGDRWRRSFLDR